MSVQSLSAGPVSGVLPNLGSPEVTAQIASALTQTSTQFVKSVEEATKKLLSAGVLEGGTESTSRSKASASSQLWVPELRVPADPESQAMTGTAHIIGMVMEFMELVGESDLYDIQARAGIQRQLASMRADALMQKSTSYAQAVNRLDAATTALCAAQDRLAACEDRECEAYEALAAAVSTAELEFRAASESAQRIATVLGATPAPTFEAKRDLSRAGLLLLLSELQLIIGKSSDQDMKTRLEVWQKEQQARTEHLEKKSQEYQEQVRKAEEAQRVMGCLFKVFGALIMVFACIAAPFTGGWSMALAAVGVALFLADMAVTEITGMSFMAEAMKPLMEHVIKPLLQALANLFTNMLCGLGVDKQTAQTVGSILGSVVGAIALVVVIVAAVALTKNAKVAEVAGKIAEKLARLIPDIARSLAREVGKMGSRITSKLSNAVGSPAKAQIYAHRFNQAAQVSMGAHTAMASASTMTAGIMKERGLLLLAESIETKAAIEAIRKIIEEILTQANGVQETLQQWREMMLRGLSSQMEAGQHVVSRMSARAA